MSVLRKNYFYLFTTDKFEKHQLSENKLGFHDILGMVFIPYLFWCWFFVCVWNGHCSLPHPCLAPRVPPRVRASPGSRRSRGWGGPGTCPAPLCIPTSGAARAGELSRGGIPYPAPLILLPLLLVFRCTLTWHPLSARPLQLLLGCGGSATFCHPACACLCCSSPLL